MNTIPIIIEGKLTIEGDQQNTVTISNEGDEALVLDFDNRKSLLYFLNTLPKHINLLKQRKLVINLLKYLDQDLIIKVAGKTTIVKKQGSDKLEYKGDYTTAFSIFWSSLKRSIF